MACAEAFAHPVRNGEKLRRISYVERAFGRRTAGIAARETLIDEARTVAHTDIPFAYMR